MWTSHVTWPSQSRLNKPDISSGARGGGAGAWRSGCGIVQAVSEVQFQGNIQVIADFFDAFRIKRVHLPAASDCDAAQT